MSPSYSASLWFVGWFLPKHIFIAYSLRQDKFVDDDDNEHRDQ